MWADLTLAAGLLGIFAVGVFTGHRWATESRRLEDFIATVEDEAENPDTIPWRKHD